MKYLKTPQESNEASENLNISDVINSIDEFRDFIDNYSKEILFNVHDESDGWNQKMSAINKILNDNKIEVSDDVWNDDEIEDIINNI
jgi:predicted metal-binding protein